MKQIFNHYKFKALLSLARLDLTFPLHYSIWENAGVAIIIFALCLCIDDNATEGQMYLALAIGFAGLIMSGKMLMEYHDKFTIKD